MEQQVPPQPQSPSGRRPKLAEILQSMQGGRQQQEQHQQEQQKNKKTTQPGKQNSILIELLQQRDNRQLQQLVDGYLNADIDDADRRLAGAAPDMQGNGAGAAGAAMAVGPTPAGHQAELNLIYGMVEELSRQLAENRRVTEDIVSGLGRVRNRARERGLSNDEVLDEAADEILTQEPNLEALLSILTEALDRAKLSRDANFSLLASYARVLSQLLAQFHAYKQRHVADVSAWHRSYRAQLAEARAENARLREQIWDMQEHAGRANALLREFRNRHYQSSPSSSCRDGDGDPRRRREVEERARRQELRFWRRMAMPEIPDDDPFWSDDDDLVDPAEKERLRELERKVAEQALAGLADEDGEPHDHDHDHQQHEHEDPDGEAGGVDQHQQQQQQQFHPVGLGGVAMERDPVRDVPPRPASTGSTGGRTG
ncbi:hypothetical protein DL769_000186 [Monosporascus sp. CRB-8-3]|nr:hypothetical protein DL769_000186 [Monosporascus sp. CRB-8-3]